MRDSQDWQRATVRRTTELSPDVRGFELVPEAGTQRYTPGSHLQLRLPGTGGQTALERHYSLVGLPTDDGAYRIAVKRLPASRGGSAAMHALREGDALLLLPPNNHFELSLAPPEHLLVAGGIGITPLLGMAQALAARGARWRMAYAVRRAGDAVYAQQIAGLGGASGVAGDRLDLFVGEQGRRLDLAAEIGRLHPQGQLLLCGPLAMVRAAQAAWAAAGRPPHLLRFETFGAGGAVANQAFRVELPRHGLAFEVPADRSLLDELQAHGIDMLWDCRRGECGLCRTEVLAVKAGSIEHRDVFFSAAEQAAGHSLCACVSRAVGPGACLVLDSAFRSDEQA